MITEEQKEINRTILERLAAERNQIAEETRALQRAWREEEEAAIEELRPKESASATKKAYIYSLRSPQFIAEVDVIRETPKMFFPLAVRKIVGHPPLLLMKRQNPKACKWHVYARTAQEVLDVFTGAIAGIQQEALALDTFRDALAKFVSREEEGETDGSPVRLLPGEYIEHG